MNHEEAKRNYEILLESETSTTIDLQEAEELMEQVANACGYTQTIVTAPSELDEMAKEIAEDLAKTEPKELVPYSKFTDLIESWLDFKEIELSDKEIGCLRNLFMGHYQSLLDQKGYVSEIEDTGFGLYFITKKK